MTDIELNEEQMAIIEEYCCNDMKKLKYACNPILIRIGGISKKDYDDIYSLAQFLLYKCVKKYDKNNDKGASFHTFFRRVLDRRMCDVYVRDRNRQCRSNTKVNENGEKQFVPDFSLDAPSKDCVAIMERIALSYNLENEVVKEDLNKKVKSYLHNLSTEQLEVANLFMEGYDQKDIMEILHITQPELNDRLNGMKAYRNISILF